MSCQDANLVAPDDQGTTHSVAAQDLVLGGSLTSIATATPGSLAGLAVGIREFTPPVSLAIVGAPGCMLHVDPLTVLPLRAVGSPPFAHVPWTGGFVSETLHIPPQPALAGGSLFCQWLEVAGPRIATTNAVECQLATTRVSSGLALVEAGFDGAVPSTGKIGFQDVPVLGLGWR